MRQVVRHFWTTDRLRCVLAAIGHPPFLFVQIVSDDATPLYSQRVKEPADGAGVAADLWRTFVVDPH